MSVMKKYKSPSTEISELREAPSHTLYNITKAGLHFKMFEEIIEQSLFTIADFALFTHVSEKTIQRRLQNKANFTSAETEKILQIYQISSRGEEVFGHKHKFKEWLNRENYALGGEKPRNLLENAFGIQLVMDELGRIEHGIFA